MDSFTGAGQAGVRLLTPTDEISRQWMAMETVALRTWSSIQSVVLREQRDLNIRLKDTMPQRTESIPSREPRFCDTRLLGFEIKIGRTSKS